MSKKANPTIVGAFILGAVALSVAAVVVFGKGSLFQQRSRAVAYFDGSVRGLNVGAPVTLRGVPVGQVVGIRIDLNVENLQALFPVYLEFNPESIRRIGTGPSGEALLAEAVQKGLHAQLAAQSFVTGQLLVELDLFPDMPVRFVGEDKSVPEIPTVPSDIEQLKGVLTRLPLQDLVASALKTANDLDAVLTSPEMSAMLSSLASAAADAREFLASLPEEKKRVLAQVMDVLGGASDTVPELRQTLGSAQEVLKTTNETLAPSLRATLRASEGAMRQAEKTLANTDGLIGANSSQRVDLNETLRNLSAASRSLRSLSDQLDRKPNSIIVGR